MHTALRSSFSVSCRAAFIEDTLSGDSERERLSFCTIGIYFSLLIDCTESILTRIIYICILTRLYYVTVQ